MSHNIINCVLGIETSCDETGVAIYHRQHGLLSQALYSQIHLHAQYGGVVPELASRDHIRKLLPLVKEVLEKAKLSLHDIDGIAYTAGPGLLGALLVGSCFGRTLAYALNKPAVAVHHMEGHLLSPMLVPKDEQPEYPFIALLVSGGHTQLIAVGAPGQYELLGETIDDAVGEAFDKTAKTLGLPYPGGPALAALAEKGNAQRFNFPRPMLKKAGCDFSFSGLKTAVQIEIQKAVGNVHQLSNKQKEVMLPIMADIAASFQQAVVDTLVQKSLRALKQKKIKRLVVAGGVSANHLLRHSLVTTLAKLGVQVYFPPLNLCADNGAMIAYAGYLRLASNQQTDLSILATPRWLLSDLPKIEI